MIPWNALPFNTIALVIGLSIVIPTLLTLLCIFLKRFEDAGFIIGLFLIILSFFSYFYLIPNEIIDKTILPEDYIWEDTGEIYYWERNSVFSHDRYRTILPEELTGLFSKRPPIEKTSKGRLVIHAASYNKENNEMLIHDALYDDKGDVFCVINNKEAISEWYTINPYTTSLEYTRIEAGSMGIPSNIGSKQSVKIGWVESNGERNGTLNLVILREMHKLKDGVIQGVPVAIWRYEVYNQPITWHGESYICDETFQLTVHPDTGYIVHVYRHLVLSARLSQFVEIYYPNLVNLQRLSQYLKLTDPYGEAAELIYQTTNESMAQHIENVKEIQYASFTIPLLICIPMFIIGLLLTWRYAGRSYYWKRYKEFENKGCSERIIKIRAPLGMIIVIVVTLSMLTILFYYIIIASDTTNITPYEQNHAYQNIEAAVHPEVSPTPPGSNRLIDSGRHVLTPDDEGIHRLAGREWWYYNVIFNRNGSDLPGWSLIISFNKMAPNDIRFVKRDNLFVILYDDKGSSYNFGMFDQPRGTLKMGKPGVNIKFKGSSAYGQYPYWSIHIENSNERFIADLNFTADFMPVWVMGRSSNLPIGRFTGGNYYIPRCTVNGNIKWDEREYRVSGTGYHDHVWETIVPRFVTNGWEWFNVHFDNGWEMYISKFNLRTIRDRYAGAIVLSPDNRDLIEFNKFTLKYTEYKTLDDIPSMVYPQRCYLEASNNVVTLKLNIDIYNTCKLIWKRSRTAMFEGPCRVTGTISWSNYNIELKGYGFSEITKVRYILHKPLGV
ncbi:MAG: lipocalin family protein [Candidatus Thermoplasmatota archaeon]